MIKEDGLPLGLGFGLAMNEEAMTSFASMNDAEKKQVIEAARGVASKEEMQELVSNIAQLGQQK
ncbi:MAG: hypothetical protein PUA77_07265 [Lachnospiraceae bacterium]|nr:hypothetical protein [Lachnospiraceae bacterium]